MFKVVEHFYVTDDSPWALFYFYVLCCIEIFICFV